MKTERAAPCPGQSGAREPRGRTLGQFGLRGSAGCARRQGRGRSSCGRGWGRDRFRAGAPRAGGGAGRGRGRCRAPRGWGLLDPRAVGGEVRASQCASPGSPEASRSLAIRERARSLPDKLCSHSLLGPSPLGFPSAPFLLSLLGVLRPSGSGVAQGSGLSLLGFWAGPRCLSIPGLNSHRCERNPGSSTSG